MTLRYVSEQTVTVAGTAVSLTVPASATTAQVFCYDARVIFTLDATTPSSTNGNQIDPGDQYPMPELDNRVRVTNFRAIRATSVSGKLVVYYFAVGAER